MILGVFGRVIAGGGKEIVGFDCFEDLSGNGDICDDIGKVGEQVVVLGRRSFSRGKDGEGFRGSIEDEKVTFAGGAGLRVELGGGLAIILLASSFRLPTNGSSASKPKPDAFEWINAPGFLSGVPGKLLGVFAGDVGNRILNSDPVRGPFVDVHSHHTSPPIFLAKPLATIKPSPKPSKARVMEVSSRAKGLKRFGRNADFIPQPLSVMLKITLRDDGLAVDTVSRIYPPSENLTALWKTQESNFLRASSST